MNSLRWNKEKMLQAVQDKKKLQQVFRTIYRKGEFFSNKTLKKLLAEQFQKVGIKLTPKATLILQFNIYKVENISEYIDGKKVNGYRFGDMIYDFKL